MPVETNLTNHFLIAMPGLEDPNFFHTVTYILHDSSTEWSSTLRVTHEISVTTSLDILEAIAAGRGPAKSLIALGYAGWGAGQLESELAQNAWLSGPAESDIIFNRPSQERWQAAADLLGVDLNLLSGDAGHA